MKKFHIHVGVKKLDQAIGFYSALFGEKPVKEKPDYAKWEPKDMNVIFAISTRAQTMGVDHLGVRVESEEELKNISDRLKKADLGVYDEGETTCCYTKSNKTWVKDPTGLPWEAYQNMEDVNIFHEADQNTTECCTPKALKDTCCAPSDKTKGKGSCC